MTAPLQDALARLDALAERWGQRMFDMDRHGASNITHALIMGGSCSALAHCSADLRAELAAIRAAHDLPASAASAAAPPADAPPCSAGLTAGASKDAPAISGVEQEKSGNAEARRQGD